MKEENSIRKDLNDVTEDWWLRSAYSYYETIALIGETGHIQGGFCGYEYWILPHFII